MIKKKLIYFVYIYFFIIREIVIHVYFYVVFFAILFCMSREMQNVDVRGGG